MLDTLFPWTTVKRIGFAFSGSQKVPQDYWPAVIKCQLTSCNLLHWITKHLWMDAIFVLWVNNVINTLCVSLDTLKAAEEMSFLCVTILLYMHQCFSLHLTIWQLKTHVTNVHRFSIWKQMTVIKHAFNEFDWKLGHIKQCETKDCPGCS